MCTFKPYQVPFYATETVKIITGDISTATVWENLLLPPLCGSATLSKGTSEKSKPDDCVL